MRFSDGREAGRKRQNRGDVAKDADGVPTEPIVGFAGGGGGVQQGWRMGVWVFPLPPDWPMEIFIGLPAAGLVETSITIEESAVRAVAAHAQVIWT